MPSELLAARLRDLALTVVGVTSMSGGVLGEAGTFAPERRVVGVRVEDDHIEIHVLLDRGAPVREVVDTLAARIETETSLPTRVWVDGYADAEDGA